MTNEERNRVIMEKLNEGMSLSDVQKFLERECGLRMTYFDLRMLAADLQVDWEKQDRPKADTSIDVSKAPVQRPQPPPPQPQPQEGADDDDVQPEDGGEEQAAPAPAPADGHSAIVLDETPIPGAAVSGTVTFPSGASGRWVLTRDGRFGLEPDEGSAQPTEDDYAVFQQDLQRKLAGDDEPEDPNAGPTVIDVDAITRPGVMVSGTVTFSSGATGRWALGGRGELDLVEDEGSAKPTRRDIQAFRRELMGVLRQKGYC